MKKLLAIAAACLAALSLSVATTWAMDIQPLRIVLEPDAGRTSATIAVNNTRDRTLPFEVEVERRIIAEDGSQTFEPAEEDFVVFPPQGSVEPGNSKAVRIQYVGGDEFAATQGYVVRIKEIPVQDDQFSGVQFAYAFGVAVYVKPRGARDNVKVDTFRRTDSGLEIGLTNSGTDYALLSAKRLRVEAKGERRDFVRDELTGLIGLPLVAPGARRTLVLETADLPKGDLTAVAFDDIR